MPNAVPNVVVAYAGGMPAHTSDSQDQQNPESKQNHARPD
jgi:hypothetical protein